MLPTNEKGIHAASTIAGRPLAMHARTDLTIQRQQFQGRDCVVIKDPLTMKYYRFEEEEYMLFKLLDGMNSLETVKAEFNARFSPQKITIQEIFQFIGMLHRNSLLISESPNQGYELSRRWRDHRRQERFQSLTNVLAIRYRGFDPDKLLGWLNGYIGWFFSIPALVGTLFLWLAALALVFTQFETFQNKLPSFESFFDSSNWIWLALVLAITKVFHEFGHGLACKRYGGECHEMGLMLLVLTPCLYVNVSDSWLLPNKWKRAMIAAAGIYVELILASLAVFVWWFSHPGLVNQLALNVVFICSVSTVLFNANPLLRYDGYYVLSDLTEIPNLRAKATTILQRTCGAIFLGMKTRSDPFLPKRKQWFFAVYSVSAALYRWLITFSIFWFVYRLLEPYGFKLIGQLIALSAIYGLVGIPLINLIRFFAVPGRLGVVKRANVVASAIGIGVVLLGVLACPLPHYVHCKFYVQPRDARNIYVDVAGMLNAVDVEPNVYVQEGQRIIELTSKQLDVQLAGMKTQLAASYVRLENIRQSEVLDASFSQGRQSAEVAVRASNASYERKLMDRERLSIRAPASGYLIAAPRVRPRDHELETLDNWNGTPLERKNIGAFLNSGTLVGQVVPDLEKMEAVLVVDQSEIEFLQQQQKVELCLNQIPGTIFHSSTERISPSELVELPPSLSGKHGGSIVTETDSEGRLVPVSTKYRVSVPLANPDRTILPGSTGHAKVRVGSKTIGQRFIRLLNETFQFEL
ncbi:MAG: site-2 protease family protein [Mariniblastus sp.]